MAQKRFEELKPFFVDCFESLCRVSVLAAAIEGIIWNKSLTVMTSKKQIDIITTEEGVRNLHLNHLKSLKKLKKRGVEVRIAAPIRDENVASELSQVAMIKSLEEAKGNVFTFDNENMLIGLTGDEVHDTQHIAFWANSEYAVKSHMKNMFETIWKEKK